MVSNVDRRWNDIEKFAAHVVKAKEDAERARRPNLVESFNLGFRIVCRFIVGKSDPQWVNNNSYGRLRIGD